MSEIKLQAVIFDLDGVIVDSEPTYDILFSHWMRDQGLECTEDYIASLFGMTWTQVFENVNQQFQTTISVDDSLRHMQHSIVDYIMNVGVPLKPGAANAITQLNQRYLLAVASSSPRAVVEQVLHHHGLYSYFNHITAAEDVLYHKPHPEPYLKTLTALNVPPEAAIIIEDSFVGIQSGAASGAFVYALPDQRIAEEKLVGLAKVVHSFDEVLADLI